MAQTPKRLINCHVNVWSACAPFRRLDLTLLITNHAGDILCLTEPWLPSQNQSNEIMLPGFQQPYSETVFLFPAVTSFVYPGRLVCDSVRAHWFCLQAIRNNEPAHAELNTEEETGTCSAELTKSSSDPRCKSLAVLICKNAGLGSLHHLSLQKSAYDRQSHKMTKEEYQLYRPNIGRLWATTHCVQEWRLTSRKLTPQSSWRSFARLNYRVDG